MDHVVDVDVARCREIVERHSSDLISDLSTQFQNSLRAAVAEAEQRNRISVRRETAEDLNQIVRRARQAATREAALGLLADSTAAYCERAVVFSILGEAARAVASRGLARDFEIPLADAAAFRTAIESRDPVVAVASPSEISNVLAPALGGDSVYLFPVAARQEVVALLLASGSVEPAALEILSEAAGMRWESLAPPERRPELPPPGLVGIAAAPKPAEPADGRSAWESLPPEEQALHLRAQRFARVRVAEMRLYRAEAVREGRSRSDLYVLLRGEIDAAREIFLRDFVRISPTMVDYFHLELLRSLTHENDRLLGPEYPGPLV